MRKFIGILVNLFIVVLVSQAAGFGSMNTTGAYRMPNSGFYTRPATSFRSTSAYSGAMSTNGFSAISSSNFAALNSEGGACYIPSAVSARRGVGRPGQGDDDYTGNEENLPIGAVMEHSPIGDVPLLFFIIIEGVLAVDFVLKRRKQQNTLNLKDC